MPLTESEIARAIRWVYGELPDEEQSDILRLAQQLAAQTELTIAETIEVLSTVGMWTVKSQTHKNELLHKAFGEMQKIDLGKGLKFMNGGVR